LDRRGTRLPLAREGADDVPQPPPASGLDIEDIFRRYSSEVAAVAHSILRRADETEDLVQDVFMVVFRGLKRLRRPDLVKSWLMTITVRVARRRLRRRRRMSERFIGEETAFDELVAPTASPEHQALCRRLVSVLDALPVDLGIAWGLHYLHAESAESVAELCGWSRSTAKRRINAAREQVLKQLS
jgi:RNA polymerase sigma-70 factor (ECF subfamily)